MRRVTRERSWGKLINKKVTRWVGSGQIDMRAHGTQKTRTEATCSHKTKTQAHGQETIHQPCAKQDTNTQLMRKLISHVFTQDMTTWKHAANEIQNPKHHAPTRNKVRRRERAHCSITLENAHSHENRTWRECQGSVTKPWITLDRSDRSLTEVASEVAFRCIYTLFNARHEWI